MDVTLYITELQGRAFIALTALLLSCAIDMVASAFMAGRTDPRPWLEQLSDFLISGISARLDKTARGQGALVMRGAFLMAAFCALYYAAGAFALGLTRELGLSGVLMLLLVGLSCGTLGWFGPLKALATHLGNAKAPRPYLALSRATYTNMVTLDDSGLIRVAADGAIRSILTRLVAPICLFVLFGWQAVVLYWPVITIAGISGQSGLNRGFAVLPNALARVFLFVPAILALPLVWAGLLFSAGASFFRAVPGLFSPARWPDLLQGGAVTLLVAYALKITLGGPRQDRLGRPVAVPWIGHDRASAKRDPRDIGRILYVQMVCVLLLGILLYVLSVIPA